MWVLTRPEGLCARCGVGWVRGSADGHDAPVLVLDDDEVGRDDLVRVHENDPGRVERVGAYASAFHERATCEASARGEEGGRDEGTDRPRMTGKYEFSTSMTRCSTVLLPTCVSTTTRRPRTRVSLGGTRSGGRTGRSARARAP